MKNEISELLQGISKEEFERFGDFVKSPYFNKLPRIVKLFDYLNERYTEAGIEAVTRESISEFMYPKEEFKNESIRKLLSDFARLLEQFLAQVEFEKNEWDKKIYILRGLRTRHYDDKFFKRLKEFKTGHKNSTQEIDEFYETNTKLISEEYEYWFVSKFGDRNEINQEKSDALDYEFIAKKLFLFQYMLSREYVNKDLKYNYTFFEEIEKYVSTNKKRLIKENPDLYRNYLSILFYFKEFDRKILLEIRALIENDKPYERKINKPYWEFINLCTYMTNLGFTEFYDDIFSFLKLLNDNELILERGTLSHYYFKIAVHASIYKKEYDWLENFILKYKKYIKYNFKDDMLNLAYANIYFEKKNYSKAKHSANKVTYKDYIHYTNSKFILFKIAYEEKDFNEINSISDTIKKYFKSHPEIPEIFKKGQIEFTKYAAALGKINENHYLGENVDYDLKEITKQINSETTEIAFKKWLLEKIGQVKK